MIELARRFSAEIHLLEVIPPPNPALYASDLEAGAGVEVATEAIEDAQEELRALSKQRLEALSKRLAGDGLRARWTVTDGSPAREIIAYAEANNIDLIAMASHGRSGLLRAIVGSVTDEVLRESGRPLLVVRAKEDGG